MVEILVFRLGDVQHARSWRPCSGRGAVATVDHGQASAHVAGEVEGGDAGTESEGGEGVA
jgi:hypothetical protein